MFRRFGMAAGVTSLKHWKFIGGGGGEPLQQGTDKTGSYFNSIFVLHKVDLNESRTLMLVKHLSRCFGKFSGYKFPNSSCVQGGLHGEYFEKFISHYFHSTAEFDITVFFFPPPHLDPRGPITFELVIMWGLVPTLLNKTQRNTAQMSVGRFDDLI